jgi:glycosyltransferase involved in cell wall biosynthesis
VTSICMLPRLQGIGGPSSFQTRIRAGLEKEGIETHHDPLRQGTDAILVIAGTRHMDQLWLARKRGIRIVQRLNGINWTQRRVFTGIRHFLRAEMYNMMMATIRRSIADEIVYQSKFTQTWWTQKYGGMKKPWSIIYNGVNLDAFQAGTLSMLPHDCIRIQVTEGHLGGGHELGLLNAVRFASELRDRIGNPIHLRVVGDVPIHLQNELAGLDWVEMVGIVGLDKIASFNQTAHLFFPCEINASCPNSVVEALACGLPVIGYETGAIRELVGMDGGQIVAYGAEATRMQPAEPKPLIDASLYVLENLAHFKSSARKRAEKLFDATVMVEAYKKVLIKK